MSIIPSNYPDTKWLSLKQGANVSHRWLSQIVKRRGQKKDQCITVRVLTEDTRDGASEGRSTV